MKKCIAVFFLVVVAAFVSSCTNYSEKADQLRIEYKYGDAVKLYQKAAEGGDAYAMWRLSRAYGEGLGVEFNQEKALEMLNKSSEKGCEEAIIDLGRAYIYGYHNLPVDTIKGVEMIKAVVANSKKPYVLVKYAYCLLDGRCFGKNDEKAFEILDSIQDKEDPNYLLAIGRIYLWGIKGVEANSEKASDFLEKAFQKGEGNAAANLGCMYLFGINNEKDIEKGVEWLKKGVSIGDAECMYRLATVYGADEPEWQSYHNTKEALSLLGKAVKSGNADACLLLGQWYASGTNVNQDYQKAFDCYRLSDIYGNTEGTFSLAVLYENGYGCEKDLALAEKYYIKAADRGNVIAAYHGLALRYEDGTFLWNEGNYKKYLELAASQGYGFALFDLGRNYREGVFGYPKDKNISFSYIKKGADLGSSNCCEMLSIYYKSGIGCFKDMEKSEEYAKKAKELDDK